jgi:hypothetical protein
MKSPKLEKLLQNKNVLYVISFIAIMNLLGYIMMKNINAAIFFSVVGFLSSYFTKNMIVILLIAMISTNLYVLGNSNVVEAMSNRRKEKTVAKKEAVKKAASSSDSSDPSNSASSTTDNTTSSSTPESNSEAMTGLRKGKSSNNKIDYAKTLTDAYSNLQTQIGPDGIEGLTNQTKELMTQQNSLMDNIKTIEPFLKTAQGFMKDLDLEGLTGLGNMVNNTLGVKKTE